MQNIESDVIVVAAGVAGLAASVSAAEAGVKVTVFEKAAILGGTGNRGTGLFAVESRLQRIKQIALTKEEAFKIFMDYTHWRVDGRLVKEYFNLSADTIDWLEKMGLEFDGPIPYFTGGYSTWHLVKGDVPGARPGSGGSTARMMRLMAERARQLGVQFFTETPVKKLIKEKGKVVGVIAENKGGEVVEARAKAVIIATGGFGANPEMVKKYTGFEIGKDMFPMTMPEMVGDGVRMAWEAGAGSTDINMEIIISMPGPIGSLDIPFRQPNLIVNQQGERFVNEEIMGNVTFAGNAISRQKNRCAYSIFDNRTKKRFETTGVDYIYTMFPDIKLPSVDDIINKAIANGHKNMFVADTIEELGAKTGLEVEQLKKTIREYNTACENGRDLLFNKNVRYLNPVNEPKYYAGRWFPGAYGSLGGIKINYKTEVITNDFDVIPGLYAAGIDVNTIYGDSYVFIIPGNTQGFAVNSGRIAGRNAANFVKSGK